MNSNLFHNIANIASLVLAAATAALLALGLSLSVPGLAAVFRFAAPSPAGLALALIFPVVLVAASRSLVSWAARRRTSARRAVGSQEWDRA